MSRARVRRRESTGSPPASAVDHPSIPVIANLAAGTMSAETLSRVREGLAARGLAIDVLDARDGDAIEKSARAALVARPRMIVAAGGDGTISAVARAVAGTGVPLGILPLGTLNHFARDLRIPVDIEGAIDVLATGRAVPVDVGEVNGRVFVNNSSIGLYPRLVQHRNRLQHRLGRGKWTALLRAALTVLHRYPAVHVRVHSERDVLARRTPLVFIGNNAYAMKGLDIGTRDRLDRGELCLYMPRRPGRFALFRIALRALFGRLRADADFDSLHLRELRIATRRPMVTIAVDGETAHARTPLVYRIRPKALRVIVPASTVREAG